MEEGGREGRKGDKKLGGVKGGGGRGQKDGTSPSPHEPCQIKERHKGEREGEGHGLKP